MAKHCKVCDSKLGIFYRKDVCKQCLEIKYDKFFTKDVILSLPKLDEKELDELKKFANRSHGFEYAIQQLKDSA